MKKLKYIIIVLLVGLISGILFYQTAKEDMLSEPTLKIYVNGMETVDYWLDLLVLDNTVNYNRIFSVRTSGAVSKLEEYYDDEGYHPAMLGGSNQKFIGRLDGYLQSDGSIRHEFWGTGIPSEFKVIILTRDKRLIISDLVKTKGYHCEVRFDIDEVDTALDISTGVGQIREVLPWKRIIFSFFIRLFAAILIKLSIAEAFGFKSKQSVKLLLKTNILTQVILNILLATQVFYGAKYALIVFVIATLFILVAEIIIYLIYLKERDKPIRVANAIVANIASAVAGYFLIFFVEWLSY